MLNAIQKQGRNYPRNTREFAAWFRDEAACQAYLEGLRWPDGFECPHCGGRVGWRVASGAFLCRECRRRTSVRAGTIFESSHLPLETWFWAAWAVTSSKRGVSALGLQRELGLPSYQTTWRLLHKLRRAMVRPDRDQLDGVVEVDETYVGGVEVGVAGRETRTKSIVVVAVEVIGDRRAGRVRLATVPNVGAAGLRPFVERAVAPGSEIRTDAWAGYTFLDRPNRAGGEPAYRHSVINVRASGDPAHVSLPHVHRVAALLKRWQLGTHQGSVTREHLDYYLDEFTFRFNRRTAKHPGLLFYRLLEQAVHIPPTRHSEIVGGTTDQRGLRGRRRAPRTILGNILPADYFTEGIDDSDPPFYLDGGHEGGGVEW